MSYATEQMQAARWASHFHDRPEGHRQCTKCDGVKPNSAFHRHAKCRGGFNSVCKQCRVPLSQANCLSTAKEVRLFNAAKSRATAKGRDFDIELGDVRIPTHCPVLGIPMTNPSIDRIDNKKGYVKGNIRVISKRANVLKNDANVEEIRLVLADLERIASQQQIL